MLDFVTIKTASFKKDTVDIYPEFLVKRSKDLLIRGRSFYAIWDDEKGLWSKSEDDVQRLIDDMTKDFADNYSTESRKVPKYLRNFSSKKWTEWQSYCKSLPDNYTELDTKIIFANTPVKKSDYVTRKLEYALEEGSIEAYDEMISSLYDPEERAKIEWAIGAIIAGDSKEIQKFIVLYGGPGSGKSTVLNIIQMLFPGYYSSFDSKALGSSNNAFALEAFRTNPLIAIQHDGDLSRIEDNTKLNSIVSHEYMTVNEKFKSTYSNKFNSFIFMATNKPVRITDSKSGILRRLIDVSPSGRRIPFARYNILWHQIQFELGAIAEHCLNVYTELGKNYYDDYIPLDMMGVTNDFYNFIEENYDFFVYDSPKGVTLNTVWMRYKEYCDEAKVLYPMSKKVFKDELKNYFSEYKSRHNDLKNFYFGFRKDRLGFVEEGVEREIEYKIPDWLEFKKQNSIFDDMFSEQPAQYINKYGAAKKKWAHNTTKLKDIDTRELHFVQLPKNVITIDFDIKDESGNKNLELNLERANRWPKTYAELSKSGQGIHLTYIYEGDVSRLKTVYDNDIEIKVCNGDAAIRRKLTMCNDIPITTINSGLPLKEEVSDVISEKQVKSEKALRELIKRNLRKEIHANTTQSIIFIKAILDEAYDSGLNYDVRDMRSHIIFFASNSTNQATFCLKMASQMKFQSRESAENADIESAPIIFFDLEVFPNLFVVAWKKHGSDDITTLINPSPELLEPLLKMRLIGFNNRKYDNHILYAAIMGYSIEQLFGLSQTLINDSKNLNVYFQEAYNLSYTDIYDFLSANNKMSLKKWEIKLGIKHNELGLPWDQPVPEELWQKVAEYCGDDVKATEAVFDHNHADWTARKILSEISGLSVNDTTNSHTTKIILGNDKDLKSQFVYTDLGTIFKGYRFDRFGIPMEDYNPGTKIVSGKSIYRGEDPGEGGYVYAEEGMHYNVALLDIVSMHPTSAIVLNIFGKNTKNFKEIVDVRKHTKEGDLEFGKNALNGKIARYLDNKEEASNLANALKTAINSVYGLTSAKFDNKLRDPRNLDNIVAKYGALFMIDLKHAVQEQGYRVVHIKTDSIKIADADDHIVEFCKEFATRYGYEFKHEDTYDRMCLINEAEYIAKYKDPKINKSTGQEEWWTATGKQFSVPYVFKKLFSHEEIVFSDLCETKSTKTALYLDYGNGIEHDYRFVGKVGLFCPIKQGRGGAILLRIEKDGVRYSAVSGTKKPYKVAEGEDPIYYWLEADVVDKLKAYEDIDYGYYDTLVEDILSTMSQYGDVDKFIG